MSSKLTIDTFQIYLNLKINNIRYAKISYQAFMAARRNCIAFLYEKSFQKTQYRPFLSLTMPSLRNKHLMLTYNQDQI